MAKALESPNLKNSTVFFVLGGPGSGKSTQCKRMSAVYGLIHLSTGDLIRQASDSDKKLRETMRRGELVPFKVVVDLLRRAMAAVAKESPAFLVDGFPRELDQAVTFEEQLAPCSQVIYFDLTEEIMKQRLLKRGPTSGRVDDNADSIAKRFKTFQELTKPVLEHYEKQGKLIKIDASRSVDEVFEQFQACFDKLGLKASKRV